jgi:hypothetical protein
MSAFSLLDPGTPLRSSEDFILRGRVADNVRCGSPFRHQRWHQPDEHFRMRLTGRPEHRSEAGNFAHVETYRF